MYEQYAREQVCGKLIQSVKMYIRCLPSQDMCETNVIAVVLTGVSGSQHVGFLLVLFTYIFLLSESQISFFHVESFCLFIFLYNNRYR